LTGTGRSVARQMLSGWRAAADRSRRAGEIDTDSQELRGFVAATPLRDVLMSGLTLNASDWHIREGRPVAFRVSGEIVNHKFVPSRDFLKQVMKVIVDESAITKFRESGDVDFAMEEEGVGRFRVNVHQQRGKISMTLRHVKTQIPTVKQLELPEILLRLSEAKDGIVFVTGATGSGKSTTLACMIQHINETTRKHIITIEDPIEYDFEDKRCVMEQREVGLDTVSFDSALRHSLRQDPDVIVVGELRSRDSFESALAAAETGHLVMTTLHTNTAAQAVGRILDFYPFEERDAVRKSLSANLRAIVCQKLVPRRDGRGLVPINEILINTPIVSNLIVADKLNKLDAVICADGEEGMLSFNQALFGRIKDGSISEEVGLKFAPNPDGLKMNLSGVFLNESSGIIA
jgi:twitching motility protein PilT